MLHCELLVSLFEKSNILNNMNQQTICNEHQSNENSPSDPDKLVANNHQHALLKPERIVIDIEVTEKSPEFVKVCQTHRRNREVAPNLSRSADVSSMEVTEKSPEFVKVLRICQGPLKYRRWPNRTTMLFEMPEKHQNRHPQSWQSHKVDREGARS
jgi:hypothetical protein